MLMPPVPGGEARAAMVDEIMKTGAGPGSTAVLLRAGRWWTDQPNFFWVYICCPMDSTLFTSQ
jgi:hypothetical protein